MCHDNEEWCKIWRKTELSFQSRLEEFDEYWPKHLEVSTILILMCSFGAKYILFELKKYRGVAFHEIEERYKVWRGINLLFQNWHKEFDKFWPEFSKVSKIFTLMGSFWAKYLLFEVKKYRGVIFHDTEEWFKIGRKIDLLLGKWRGILQIFTRALESVKIGTLMRFFCPK